MYGYPARAVLNLLRTWTDYKNARNERNKIKIERLAVVLAKRFSNIAFWVALVLLAIPLVFTLSDLLGNLRVQQPEFFALVIFSLIVAPPLHLLKKFFERWLLWKLNNQK